MQRLKARWRLLVAMVAMVTGIAMVFETGAVAQPARAPRLTAVQIADAVLFNAGPAAGYTQAIKRQAFKWDAEGKGLHAAVVKAIENDKSGYYNSLFSQQMQSGDPQQVEKALNNLGQTAFKVLQARYGAKRMNQWAAGASPQETVNPVISWAVAVAAVLVTVSVVYSVFIGVAFLIKPAGQTGITHEELVANVTNGLRA